MTWIFGAGALADIPTEMEPDYSEAVLAYNAKNYDRALTILNTLLEKSPEVIEFVELKALTLKVTHQAGESAQLYEQLIAAKKREQKPDKELAPYQFELATIHYREKKMDLAQKEYEFALEQNFNAPICHLYLGMITFKKGDFSGAAAHFEGALGGEAADIEPVIHFYLAQAHLKTGYPTGATHHLLLARNTSRRIVEDPKALPQSKQISEQIRTSSEKALAPFDKGQWFANLTALSGYDSNVMFLPTTLVKETDISKVSAAKSTLIWGGGYASSPLSRFQVIPSLRGTYNRNWNENARGFEFFSNTGSVYLNHTPLDRTSFGLKSDFTLMFKNNYSTQNPKTLYQIYSHMISVGPYLRREIFKKILSGIELFYQPQKIYQDSKGDDMRSGNDFFGRIFIQNDEGRRFFNPQASVRYDMNQAGGVNFKSTTLGFTVSNLMHLIQKFDMNLTADYSMPTFKSRKPKAREDKLMIFSLTTVYKITPKWSVMGMADWTQNASNLSETYSFNRITGQAGVNYAF